jgi:hypothetical protein
MLLFEYVLLCLTVFGLLLGSWGILWGRTSSCPHRAWLGRLLFVAALLLVGIAMQFAAFYQADGLVPLGLSAGVLLVAMLWETPATLEQRNEEMVRLFARHDQ